MFMVFITTFIAMIVANRFETAQLLDLCKVGMFHLVCAPPCRSIYCCSASPSSSSSVRSSNVCSRWWCWTLFELLRMEICASGVNKATITYKTKALQGLEQQGQDQLVKCIIFDISLSFSKNPTKQNDCFKRLDTSLLVLFCDIQLEKWTWW